MLNIADLLVVQVLKQTFSFLSSNPAHAEFILCGFQENPLVNKLVGPEYVKQAVELFKQRIHITPYYEYDLKRTPSISVISSGNEDQQFLGDYGSNELGPIYCKPRVYAKWDASAIDIENNTMSVSESYQIQTKLWSGILVTDGVQELRLSGLLAKEGQDTLLYFKDETPIKTVNLKGWSSQSGQPQKGYEINSSIDNVTIQCKLTTVGDSSVHRLWQIALRYAIKSRRLLLDSYGLQCSSITYSPMILSDEQEQMFESVVTITAKAPESWIGAEYDLNGEGRIDIQLVIAPEFPETGDASFLIDNFASNQSLVEIVKE